MPIVLATGYGNAVKPVEANSSFLQKPYTKAGLIAALRSVGFPERRCGFPAYPQHYCTAS
jgi:hypothetical protein